MNVLIIEDERHTANFLSQLLKKIDKSINILGLIGSVEGGIRWFREHKMPDLVFQDIMLSDGNSFDIYDAVDMTSPIVFTTAYSDYAIRSFEVNSIGYLIKPYDVEDIKKILDKFDKLKGTFSSPDKELVKEILSKEKITYKKRFLIKTGDNYSVIKSSEIAFLISEDGLTVATLFDMQKKIVDFSIDTLAKQLPPDLFFQINRKAIINIESVVKISKWFSGRLKVETNPPTSIELIVSRERVKPFKQMLGA
jgi:two-component system response regulator LytT